MPTKVEPTITKLETSTLANQPTLEMYARVLEILANQKPLKQESMISKLKVNTETLKKELDLLTGEGLIAKSDTNAFQITKKGLAVIAFFFKSDFKRLMTRCV